MKKKILNFLDWLLFFWYKEPELKKCTKSCGASSGIHEGITFGRGKCNEYGYWDIPCYLCARSFEKKHPEHGMCWPFARDKNDKIVEGHVNRKYFRRIVHPKEFLA